MTLQDFRDCILVSFGDEETSFPEDLFRRINDNKFSIKFLYKKRDREELNLGDKTDWMLTALDSLCTIEKSVYVRVRVASEHFHFLKLEPLYTIYLITMVFEIKGLRLEHEKEIN